MGWYLESSKVEISYHYFTFEEQNYRLVLVNNKPNRVERFSKEWIRELRYLEVKLIAKFGDE